MATLPLEGIRVADITVIYAGPSATMHLADWGAEVIRVESTIKGETTFTMEGAARIQYEYAVNGNTYENDRIWYAIRTNTRPIKQLTDGLRPNSPVPVCYDPNNPARSVLLRGHDPNNWSLLVLSLLGPVGAWLLWNRRLDADQEELLKKYLKADTSEIRKTRAARAAN